MSVFHRVDDMERMPAKRFLSLAARIAHYDGAIRHAATIALRDDPPDDPPGSYEMDVDLAAAGDTDAMAIHPVWGQLGSYSKAPLQPEG